MSRHRSKPGVVASWSAGIALLAGSVAFAQVGIVNEPSPDFGKTAEWERACDLQHVAVDLDLDIEKETFKGIVAEKMSPLREGVEEIELDADGMRITKVEIHGQPVRYDHKQGKLRISLPKIYRVGESFEVTIEYEGDHPPKGLFFVHADPSDEKKTNQAWTQGEDEDNHYWVPIWDHPNDRTSWEISLTVDPSLTAVSNGVLLDTKDVNGKKRFHWKMEQPNVTYLMAFAVGPWEHYTDSLHGILVDYYVNKGVGEETCRRSFGETPEILAFFEKETGVEYPWPKYSQVAVEDFVVGGMENVSCTLQTDRTLHDATQHLETESRSLVAHEAAHQWFGDLQTCRTWKDLWLNEGFAQYYEALYMEYKLGQDEFRLEMRGNQSNYQRSEGDKPRPMVADFFSRSDDQWNHFVYVKGASVLHMLRFVLGDDGYRRSISHYLKTHRDGLVDSHDLQIAIADATGKNLEWFFEQWVYLCGWPKFEVTFDYDAEHKSGALSVKQTQKTGPLVPVFRTPVDVEFVVDGHSEIHRIFISEREQRFDFALSKRPSRVRFDKGGWICKELKFDKSVDELVDIALNDDDAVGRIEAVIALQDSKDPKAEACLVKVLASKDHRSIKNEAIAGLAKKKSDNARAALLAALDDADARVRREAASRLGEFPADAATNERLRKVVASDPAYNPRGNALRSLAKLKDKSAFPLAEQLLGTPSAGGTLASAGLDAMIQLDPSKAAARTLELAANGMPVELRQDAIRALGRLKLEGEDRKKAIDIAMAAFDQKSGRMKRAAIDAFSGLGATEALEKLDALVASSSSEFQKRGAENAAKAIREKAGKDDGSSKLKKEIEELKARLEKLEHKN